MGARQVSVAGVDLEVFERGSGRAVLFLHCGAGFQSDAPFAAMLADKVRLIAPSHPGFGRSSLPDWVDRIEDIPHIYLELIDKLGLEQVDVIGCSIGGWIGLEMATMAPERFGKIVLLGPVGVKVGPVDRLDVPDIWAMSQQQHNALMYRNPANAQIDVTSKTDEELEIMVRNRESLSLLTWEPYMHNPKLKHRLQRVRSPALFLRGEFDGLVSQPYLTAYAALVGGARTAVVADAAHAAHIEQPGAFAKAALDFLAE